MTSAESWVVFLSNDKNLNYSHLDWEPYGNTWCTQTAGASVSLTYEYDIVYAWAAYYPANGRPPVSATQDGNVVRILQPPPLPPGDTYGCTDPDALQQWLVVFAQDELKNHTLEIVAEGASEVTPFCLWRIDVTTPVVRLSTLAEGNAAGSNGTASSSTATQTSSPTSSSTSSALSSASASRRSSTGAIVGGVIGAVALTLLICGVLFYWYRRQHKHRYTPTDMDDQDSGRTSPTKSHTSSSLRPFFLPKLFPRRKPTEPGWIEPRPPVSLLPHVRRTASANPPPHASPSQSSTERALTPVSEHTGRLSELGGGLEASSGSQDERSHSPPPRSIATVGEVETAESLRPEAASLVRSSTS